jgi:hypothetical protein
VLPHLLLLLLLLLRMLLLPLHMQVLMPSPALGPT